MRVFAYILTYVRILQTNALESELRSARDVVRLRADMDLQRRVYVCMYV